MTPIQLEDVQLIGKKPVRIVVGKDDAGRWRIITGKNMWETWYNEAHHAAIAAKRFQFRITIQAIRKEYRRYG